MPFLGRRAEQLGAALLIGRHAVALEQKDWQARSLRRCGRRWLPSRSIWRPRTRWLHPAARGVERSQIVLGCGDAVFRRISHVHEGAMRIFRLAAPLQEQQREIVVGDRMSLGGGRLEVCRRGAIILGDAAALGCENAEREYSLDVAELRRLLVPLRGDSSRPWGRRTPSS